MIGGAGRRGKSCSAACCCVSQKAFLRRKRRYPYTIKQCQKIYWTFPSVLSRCNYSHCCTRVFDEPEGFTFREGGHFIWRFFRRIFEAPEWDTAAVHHQLRQLWAEFRTDLRRANANIKEHFMQLSQKFTLTGLTTSLSETDLCSILLGGVPTATYGFIFKA